MELHTIDGLVKDRTHCAPNGYYFLPVYDKVGSQNLIGEDRRILQLVVICCCFPRLCRTIFDPLASLTGHLPSQGQRTRWVVV